MRNSHLFLLTAIFVFPLFGYFFEQVQAASTQLINTQVQVSICGNYVVEGGEDCEGLDLDGQNCYSLGFSGGQLSCDIACSFDTYECLAPIITPTPSQITPTPVTNTTQTAAEDSLVVQEENTSTVSEVSIGNQAIARLIDQTTQTPSLPEFLQKFDIRGEGKLRLEDLPRVVTLWVQDWRVYLTESLQVVNQTEERSEGVTSEVTQDCDLNQDKTCNLIDFSILLHYIES